MKRIALLLALWYYLSSWSYVVAPLKQNGEDSVAKKESAVFVLPSSLVSIGESAFENTGAEKLIIQNEVKVIEDRAFANIDTLHNAYIPESVVFIGDHAFDGNPELKICGAEGSYVAEWAKTHDVAFTPQAMGFDWLVITLQHISFFLTFSFVFSSKSKEFRQRRRTKYVRSMRPQDRPELYWIDCVFPDFQASCLNFN